MVRAANIALRTAHIGAMSVLLGGHAFDVSPERLQVSLWATIGTGAALAVVESGFRLLWLHQGRGLMTLGKLALLCLVPLAWDYRIPILLLIVLVASVGSHMSGRFRYYSFLYRRIVHDGYGPGAKKLQEPQADLAANSGGESRP